MTLNEGVKHAMIIINMWNNMRASNKKEIYVLNTHMAASSL